MQGRKPKPTHLRLVEGNKGKRAFNAKEPKPKLRIPLPPDHLCEAAVKEWHRLSQELYDLGILTNLDSAMLAGYCSAYGRWVKATLELQSADLVVTSATGQIKQHPLIGIIHTSQREMRAFAAELGLSPVSRSRVKAEPPHVGKKASSFF